jgi:hypothetical protein
LNLVIHVPDIVVRLVEHEVHPNRVCQVLFSVIESHVIPVNTRLLQCTRPIEYAVLDALRDSRQLRAVQVKEERNLICEQRMKAEARANRSTIFTIEWDLVVDVIGVIDP